jgi:hypothetical protein
MSSPAQALAVAGSHRSRGAFAGKVLLVRTPRLRCWALLVAGALVLTAIVLIWLISAWPGSGLTRLHR